MPPDEPLRRVDIIPLEELAASANEEGQVKFCRCWKSKTFRVPFRYRFRTG